MKGLDYLPEGKYNLVLGGGACTVMVRHVLGTGPPRSPEIVVRFGFRVSVAKYNSEPGRDFTIIKIVDG